MSKKCKSISPTSMLRCGKDRGHDKRGDAGHMQGALVWYPPLPEPPLSPAQKARRDGRIDELRNFDFDLNWTQPPPTMPQGKSTGEQALIDWWVGQTASEIEQTAPKVAEYGATDLVDIGSQLGRFIGRDISDAEAAELGCWFYLIGKMGRATSALERGDWPSDDTIMDAGIYLKMIQRIRHSGGWPNGE